MLSRDRILTPIANAFFAFLKWLDAIRGRSPIGEIGPHELRNLQTKAAQKKSAQKKAAQNTSQEVDQHPVPRFLIVDVRSEAEQSVSMIPGAITKADFETQQIAKSQLTVIPYCTVGGRSYLYARKLASQGIPTQNFKEGIVGWCNANLPLVDIDGQPTNRVYLSDPALRVPAEYEVVR